MVFINFLFANVISSLQIIVNFEPICISYATSVRYVAGINHEARGIYSGNVPNRGRDISNLCHHEPVAMVNGTTFLVLSP